MCLRLLVGALLALPSPLLRAQVTETLVDLTGATWRYNDTGAVLPASWRANNFSAENSWPSGTGLFGVEGDVPYPYPATIRTPLALVPGRITYYFRTRFNYSGQTAGLTLQATAYLDDGAILYLNGEEVARARLPAGTISATTKAQLAFPEGEPLLISIPGSRLVQGQNVIAVELHQSSDTSSDVLFGLSLGVLSERAPSFLNPAEPGDRAVAQEGSTTLLAAAGGMPAPRFQWFQDNLPVARETNDSLFIGSMSAANAGRYFCVASNSLGSVTSRVANVTYLPDTNGPSLVYVFGQANLMDVLVVFSEPPEPGSATDNFGWKITLLDGSSTLTVLSGSMTSSTSLLLSTLEPRDPNAVYVIRRTSDLAELVDRGNPLPAGSEMVIASFPAPLVLMDDVQAWRYSDRGIDHGRAWKEPGFDDGDWAVGRAPFDVSRQPDGVFCRSFIPAADDPVRTCLSLSNATGTAQIPTAYFRTTFQFEGDAAHSVLRITNVFNDGLVLYLNGVEFLRAGMPEGEISFATLATQTLGDAIQETQELHVPSLVVGENVLAAEVHQGTLKSDNLTFGIALHGILPARPVTRPRMIIRRSEAFLEIIWSPPGGVLEFSDDPASGWAPVQEIYSSDRLRTPAGEQHRFYRVVMPE